jgi:hypothetical protein
MSKGKGPKPFSSEWLAAPPAPPEPARRLPRGATLGLRGIAMRLPGEHALATTVVLLMVLVSLGVAGPRSQAQTPTTETTNAAAAQPALATRQDPEVAAPTEVPTLDLEEAEPEPRATITTETLSVKSIDEVARERQASAPKLNLQQPREVTTTEDGLLPEYRILTFYGFPGNRDMGILGQHDKEKILKKMRQQAAAYEAVDPSRPVLVGFEVIASVAQAEPQADGSYLLDTPAEMLDEYAEFAEENEILLFLDVQIGRRTVADEIKGLEPWLKKPHVHLALDPEFAMREGEIPGTHIGQVTADDIAATQEWLAKLAERARIPPKVLIVHQFHYTMIESKKEVAPVEGVQLVIDSDGWGTPQEKRATYDVVNNQLPIEYFGVKLFYSQDKPLMTPEEILALGPTPDLIIYQ